MTITKESVAQAILDAAERVGFSQPLATIGIEGRMVTISFNAYKLTVGRTVSTLHDLDNLARIAVIRAIHHQERP